MQKIILLLSVIFLAVSCSVSKRSGGKKAVTDKPGTTIDYAGVISKNNLSGNNFFIRKADISLTKDNVTSKFTATIRYKKPFTLLVSVRSKIGGIEAARAYLTVDTLLINDRINRRLIAGDPEKLELVYGISSTMIFALLGDFIIDKKDENRALKCTNGLYSDSFALNEKRVDYRIDCNRRKVTEAYFEGGFTTGNISLSYSRFKNMNGITIPQLVGMSDDLSGLRISMEIGEIEVGWTGDLEFIPGRGYEVVYLK